MEFFDLSVISAVPAGAVAPSNIRYARRVCKKMGLLI